MDSAAKRSTGIREEDLLSLVEVIYDAALERKAWPDVLSRIANVTRSATAAVVLPGRERSAPVEMITVGIDPDFERKFKEYYWQHEPWNARMSPRNLGVPLPGRAVVPLEELRRTEFYNDCWGRHGLLDSFSVSLVVGTGSIMGSLSGARLKGDDEYADADLELLRPLVPHLRRALEIDAQLSRSSEERDNLLQALDRLPLAVLVANGSGAIVCANRSAERVLASADGLYAPRGVLGAAQRSTTEALLKMIAEASQPGVQPGFAAGGWLALRRPSGRRDLAVTVGPLGEKGSVELGDRGLAIVFISDPEHQVELPRSALQRLWKLTGAEAELAFWLVNGHSLERACEVIGVTRNTGKTQLARIFSKTGTHRQGELVGLLARTVGGLAQP